MSTAMLLALARAMGIGASPEALASACLEAEGAVDPLMMDRPETLLWASREARAVRSLPQPPALAVVGGFLGPPIQTVPDDSRFADISDLVPNWIAAAEAGDRIELARIATVSAERTTALRGPADDGTATLALAVSKLADEFLDGKPGQVRRIGGRFRAMVLMPSTMVLEVLGQSADTLFFQVLTANAEPAISQGFLSYGGV